MYETIKKNVLRVFLCALCFIAGVIAGECHAHFGSDSGDTERTRHYEAASTHAQELAERAGSELERAGEEMHAARERIDGSLTVVGEVRAIGDTITKNSTDAQGAAGRIEEGISRIGEIISDAEKARSGAYGNDSDRHGYSGH